MHFNSSKKLVFNDGIMNWNVLKLTFHAKIKRNRHVLKIKNYSTLRKGHGTDLGSFTHILYEKIKVKAQFLFLCNTQNPGALRVCITFPQKKKKKKQKKTHVCLLTF